ncbi:low choriolytic enzyme-like isoform X2 [Leuresthes tenuis]|uniref:low choriolytic enzyme-like isoform X2 n=1 Tax=Leuresthes tenuis TaxID=355514 RepID=UPI003B50886A
MDLTARVSLLLLLLLGFCKAHPGEDHGADNVVESEDDFTATILRMNNGSADMLVEGDVFIPRTRTAMKCMNKQFSCLWPKSRNGKVNVPFTLSEKYDDSEKSIILSAMKGFEPKTCIRFIPRRSERMYLSIEPKHGCFSLLGRIGDKQVVSLQRFGCVAYGIVQHELMHALGFYHEHTRSDRDQYVKINWDNVKKYYVRNFKKMDTDNLGTSYDYSSVMQYGRTAFGMSGKETIIPIPDNSVEIGQRKRLSATDILRINKLYKC